MCDFAINCKNPAAFVVIQKAFMQKPERRINACLQCASRIGSLTSAGPVIELPSRETRFYKIEELQNA